MALTTTTPARYWGFVVGGPGSDVTGSEVHWSVGVVVWRQQISRGNNSTREEERQLNILRQTTTKRRKRSGVVSESPRSDPDRV